LDELAFDGVKAHDLAVMHPDEGTELEWVAVGLVDEQA
jgi:hypothetical protein